MGNLCTGRSILLDESFDGFDLTGPNDPRAIAKDTCFSEDEVYALFELFRSVSSSVVAVFDLFDVKRNGVVDFGEFVRSLSVFHPGAPFTQKADFAFRIYDLKKTGVIDKDEVHNLLSAMLNENPDLRLPKEAVGDIVDRTFQEVGKSKTGCITTEEWHELCSQNPMVIGYMTLPVLNELTTKYPSFAFKKPI